MLDLRVPGAYNTSAAVMIWFYGGAFKVCLATVLVLSSLSTVFQEGGESFALYDGAYIASTSNTIVIATNYRIDVLGWLYLSGVRHTYMIATLTEAARLQRWPRGPTFCPKVDPGFDLCIWRRSKSRHHIWPVVRSSVGSDPPCLP